MCIYLNCNLLNGILRCVTHLLYSSVIHHLHSFQIYLPKFKILTSFLMSTSRFSFRLRTLLVGSTTSTFARQLPVFVNTPSLWKFTSVILSAYCSLFLKKYCFVNTKFFFNTNAVVNFDPGGSGGIRDSVILNLKYRT